MRRLRRGKRGRVLPGREEIVAKLREVAAKYGERVLLHQFTRLTGITQNDIYRHFDSWRDVREEAGLPRFVASRRRYSENELMQAFHQVLLKIGRLPTFDEFHRHARISRQPLYHRYGSMEGVQEAYLRWLKGREGEFPDLAEGEVRNPTQARREEDRQRDLRWLRNRWCALRVGFELKSSDFADLPPDACDLLVVLKDDWPACPVPVIEYCTLMGERRAEHSARCNLWTGRQSVRRQPRGHTCDSPV